MPALFMNFSSACLFYLAAFFLHRGIQNPEQTFVLDFSVYVFFRQTLGLLMFTPFFLRRIFQGSSWKILMPSRWVLARCLFNLLALLTFYQAIALNGAGRANVINMTYPVFVMIFAGWLLGENVQLKGLLLAMTCLFGVILCLPQKGSLSLFSDDVWLGFTSLFSFSSGIFFGLASAVFAGLAILSLRGAATRVHPVTILFWLFLLGSFFSFLLCRDQLKWISAEHWNWLLLSALSGVGGQWFLTLSYQRLNALTGSLISTTRIPIALLVGVFILGEKFLWNEWLGAIFIFFSNVFQPFQKSIHRQE